MGHAWPRFLPEMTPEALAHALIIEAYAIIVEHFAEGQGELTDAHKRAANYARQRYSPDEIHSAFSACAAAPGNSNILLYDPVVFTASTLGDPTEPKLAA